MDKKKTKRKKCSERVNPHFLYRSYPCIRNASEIIDGRDFCWQHARIYKKSAEKGTQGNPFDNLQDAYDACDRSGKTVKTFWVYNPDATLEFYVL